MIYLSLFFIFAQIGLFGFGGGVAMLPLIYQGAKTFGLITSEQFANLVAIAQVTPGPIAVNAATYVGYNSQGFLGAAIATFGVALPSFLLVTLAYRFVNKFRDSNLVKWAFDGIRPVTAGLLVSATIFIGCSTFVDVNLVQLSILAVTVLLMFTRRVNPMVIIVGAGIIGAIFCK